MWSRFNCPLLLISLAVLSLSVRSNDIKDFHSSEITIHFNDSVVLYILGTIQDGGSPHIGCNKKCCAELFKHQDPNRMVVCLGLAEPAIQKSWMIEATPDFSRQVQLLSQYNGTSNRLPNGILLTHAHIGHYSGLMFLGREAMNSQNLPVYAQPRMKHFLENNGPWDQLVKLRNIRLSKSDSIIILSDQIQVKVITVTHRDEYSETVAYIVEGPKRKAFFIPDIDKWEKWNRDIGAMISMVEIAFLDATFYDAAEVNYRDIKEIPHPLVSESMEFFKSLPLKDKNKIYFIHLNHTNPLLDPLSPESRTVENQGYHVARLGMKFNL